MAYLNETRLIGHLTRDVELKTLPGRETKVANFGFATNRPFKNEAGEACEEACFFEVVAWEGKAELCAKYLKSGDPAFIAGSMQLDQWEDKTSGQKRSQLKLRLDDVQFLGAPRSAGSKPETIKPSDPQPVSTGAAQKVFGKKGGK